MSPEELINHINDDLADANPNWTTSECHQFTFLLMLLANKLAANAADALLTQRTP